MIKENLNSINTKIAEAAYVVGRDPEKIKLIAVTKTIGVESIKEAVLYGQQIFAENYVQEAKTKVDLLQEEFPNLEFHLIGHLQRNKAKEAVQLFSLIHTLDRKELVIEINKYARNLNKVQRVLMQVNISGEVNKAGVSPEQALELAHFIIKQENLKLEGLMCIGKFIDVNLNEEERIRDFKEMRKLQKDLENKLSCSLPELSMGMSHDFDLAIKEGATMIRIGTAIFGERYYGI